MFCSLSSTRCARSDHASPSTTARTYVSTSILPFPHEHGVCCHPFRCAAAANGSAAATTPTPAPAAKAGTRGRGRSGTQEKGQGDKSKGTRVFRLVCFSETQTRELDALVLFRFVSPRLQSEEARGCRPSHSSKWYVVTPFRYRLEATARRFRSFSVG